MADDERPNRVTALAMFFGVVGATLSLLTIGYALREAAALRAEHMVWETGVRGEVNEVTGRSTKGPYAVHDLTIGWYEVTGRHHRPKVRYRTLFGTVDRGTKATVRYDAHNPERFAVSVGIDLLGARWRALALITLSLLSITVPIAGVGVLPLVRRRAAAAESTRRAASGGSYRSADVTRADGPPMTVLADRDHYVALDEEVLVVVSTDRPSVPLTTPPEKIASLASLRQRVECLGAQLPDDLTERPGFPGAADRARVVIYPRRSVARVTVSRFSGLQLKLFEDRARRFPVTLGFFATGRAREALDEAGWKLD